MSTLPMPIKCVAPFAGGKRRLAKRIVELLGPHDTYVEPFVGGCSILPVKPKCREESVLDANKMVGTVLYTLIHSGADVIRLLAGVKFDKAEFDFARGYVAAAGGDRRIKLDPELAARQLLVWWQGPGGIAGTDRKGWFAQRHTKTGGCPAKRWASFLASLPALCERLAGVDVMFHSGWQHMQEDYWPDDRRVAYYVDPPYLSKSFTYAVDFRPGEHAELAEALNGLTRARVVVSYYDDGAGTLARLYPPTKWRRIDVEMSKNMSAAGGKTSRAVEVLLVNDAGGR